MPNVTTATPAAPVQPLEAQEATPAPSAATSAPPRGCSHFKLRQTDRAVSRFYDTWMGSATGLKTSQYSLLSHIAKLEPIRPADLAARMTLEPSSLTRNVQALVAQGWAIVGPGADGRSRVVTLTEAGHAKRQESQAAWKRAQLAFNDKLGEARVAQLHALLDECLQCMSADNTTATGDPADD